LQISNFHTRSNFLEMNRILSLLTMIFVCNVTFSQTRIYKYKLQIDSVVVNDTTPWRHQICAYDYSIIGEYRMALETWDEPRKKIKAPALKEDLAYKFFKYKPQQAGKYIIGQAKKTSLLIINEAHHEPRHRVFTESLLKDLWNSGYRYMCFETLDNRDSLLNKRKYPTKASGYYSNEPSFGNLIRSALRLGYKIFPYESEGNGKEREIGQANNIKSIMDKNTNGKSSFIVGSTMLWKIQPIITGNWLWPGV
jgi:REP element-mobilizing transposase RayT